MINFKRENFTATVAVALTLGSAPALANGRAPHVGHPALTQIIIVPDAVSPVSARTTDGSGGARFSKPKSPAAGSAPSTSFVDDPNQPETATGLDLNGPPRRFPINELPKWDSTQVH